jgi:hypothetical protein
VSGPRFASITAGLLARKGQAQPWSEPAKRPLSWERGELPPASGHFKNTPQQQAAPEPAPAGTGFFRSTPPPAAEPAHGLAHSAHEWKKIAVRMSQHDYERLGILAVKQNKTRQRLLHEAVDRLLAGITLKYSTGCACLGAEKTP